MANPVPGKTYIIVDENTLSKVAARAYGDYTLWPLIWKANRSELKSDDPNFIFPGEIIFIPILSERERLKLSVSGPVLTNKAKDAFTIILDDMEIIPVSGRIIRTMDTLSDAWNARIKWTYGQNKELDSRVKPFSYTPASVYIGSQLMVKGYLFKTKPQADGGGNAMNLSGAAFTKNMADSTLRSDFEANNITLLQRCKSLSESFGVGVIVEDGLDIEGAFERVAAGPMDKIGAHLVGLAKQKAALLTSTFDGQLLITQARTGKPIATLEEGKQGVGSFGGEYDGTKRFRNIRAIAQTPDGEIEAASNDANVSVPRFTTFTANDTNEGNIQKAADWHRSRVLANALSFSIPIDTWFDPSGNLWQENTLIIVVSPANHLPNGVVLIIQSVEFTFEGSGLTAVLNVVPPEVFTGELIKDPWE